MQLTHDHHGDNLDDAGRALLPSAGVVITTKPGLDGYAMPTSTGSAAWLLVTPPNSRWPASRRSR